MAVALTPSQCLRCSSIWLGQGWRCVWCKSSGHIHGDQLFIVEAIPGDFLECVVIAAGPTMLQEFVCTCRRLQVFGGLTYGPVVLGMLQNALALQVANSNHDHIPILELNNGFVVYGEGTEYPRTCLAQNLLPTVQAYATQFRLGARARSLSVYLLDVLTDAVLFSPLDFWAELHRSAQRMLRARLSGSEPLRLSPLAKSYFDDGLQSQHRVHQFDLAILAGHEDWAREHTAHAEDSPRSFKGSEISSTEGSEISSTDHIWSHTSDSESDF